MTIVITACTNRKRKPISDSLHFSALSQGSMADVLVDWTHRLRADGNRFAAAEVYGGRGFQQAVAAATKLDADLLVASAGLGLINASTLVPPYGCTVLPGAPDSVGARIAGDVTSEDWWAALSESSPFGVSLANLADQADGLICVALSEAYFAMIAGELMALPAAAKTRLRLFTGAPNDRLPADLRAYVMPYDERLDGRDSPIPGTRGDFAARALRHFAENISTDGDARSASEHAHAVTAALEGWRSPPRFNRQRLDDAEMIALIREHWDAERGSSSRLLRHLRDVLQIACEQGRFAELARQVRGERA